METLNNLGKILKGKDKLKIIGLSVLLVLCFAIVYATSNPFSVIESTDDGLNAENKIISNDFANVLSSVEGAGEVLVYITYEDEKQTQVMGVIIVAEGAKDLNVAMKLQQAAATAYGISIDRIEVFQMKGVN